jgi:hypothetical protein
MAHNNMQPLAPAALVAAAAAAADLGFSRGLDASDVDTRQRAVIRRLLSAAVQQDIAATCAALLLYKSRGFFREPREGFSVMTGVLLETVWLAAAAERAELEAMAANYAAGGCEGGC